MSKSEFYKQCNFESGNKTTTAWIPEHGAKLGFSMVFEDDEDKTRWTVTSVGDHRITKAEANIGSRASKTFVAGPQEMKRRRKG